MGSINYHLIVCHYTPSIENVSVLAEEDIQIFPWNEEIYLIKKDMQSLSKMSVSLKCIFFTEFFSVVYYFIWREG